MRALLAICVFAFLGIFSIPATCEAYDVHSDEIFIAYMSGAKEIYNKNNILQVYIENDTIYDAYTKEAVWKVANEKIYLADKPGHSVALIDENRLFTYIYTSDKNYNGYNGMKSYLIKSKQSYYTVKKDIIYRNRPTDTAQTVITAYIVSDSKFYRPGSDGTLRQEYIAMIIK